MGRAIYALTNQLGEKGRRTLMLYLRRRCLFCDFILRIPSFLQSHLGADTAVSPSSLSIQIIVRPAEGLQNWGDVVSQDGSEGGKPRAYLAGYLKQWLPNQISWFEGLIGI